ncbi:MAG: TonB-dependent receptor [Burkholderiales bacterium]|nr:TonB-dependent receptor [Burkholderiales bacterium]
MKNCTPRARLATLTVALATAFSAHAQLQLKDQVVTASRVATPVTDVIADVSIIDRAQLELAGQSSLRDLLGQQAGVQFVSNGSYRSTTGMFLRGATTAQTLVLVDGVRVGSATSGGASFENLPLSRIERVEILRGAASALYGPDAVGGVIQIFTREPGEGLQMDANAGTGTDGQQQLGASVRGSSGALGYSLGVSREKANGISVVTNPAAGGYNPDADGFTATSADAKLSAKLSKEHTLTLSLLHSDTDLQFDGTPFPNPLGLTKLSSDPHSKLAIDNATLKWDAQWLAQWRSTLVVGTSDDKSVGDYFRISDGAYGGSTKFNTSRRQATWQNDISFDKDVLSLMLETRNETVDSSTAYTVSSRDVRSALVSYALNRPGWNALAVARNDDNSQFGNVSNWALSGGYRLTDALRAVGSVGTSFQAPTFNQLYFPGFGNTALTPQRNRATELGLKYQAGNLSLGAVAYNNDIQGFIIPQTNVQSSLAVLRGVTLTAAAQVGETSYTLSYDYADPRSYSTNPASNDLRLVRVAQNLFNARVNHRMGPISVFGELKLSGDREDSNLAFSGRDVLPGYTLLNVGATWQVQKNVSVLGRINNLTDAQYMLANTYSMPGRNLFVSVNWAL